jgi:hypothetical protein
MTLKSDMTSDQEIFNDPDEHGTAAVYSVGGVTINGIFNDSYEAVSPLTGEVELTKPQFNTSVSNVPTAAHGQTLTINSVVYKITGTHPDGTGRVTLILSKDAE